MVHLLMKIILIFIVTVIMGLFSLNGQTLSLQNLIDFSEPNTEVELSEDLKTQGIYFSEINETTPRYSNEDESLTASLSQMEVNEPNRLVYLNLEDYQEIKFTTTDEGVYRSLLDELRSEALQFQAF